VTVLPVLVFISDLIGSAVFGLSPEHPDRRSGDAG